MTKLLRSLFFALVALLIVPSVAHADPVVTSTYRSAGSYRFTLTADAGTALYTAGPTDGTNPATTGGCKIVSHRNAMGRVIIDGVRCLTPGTVGWNSPIAPKCETVFSIRADGVVIWSTTLNSPCPPPPPPAVSVTYVTNLDADPDLDQIVFYNPATVSQQSTVQFSVPSLDYQIVSDAPVTYWTTTEYASSNGNYYVYFLGHVQATLAAGQTITVDLP